MGRGQGHATCFMAAEGKAIIFYRFNLFIYFYFVSIDKRPAMGSQPNLASRSEVVSIYKCPSKNWGVFPQIWGAKNPTFLITFFAISALDTLLNFGK